MKIQVNDSELYQVVIETFIEWFEVKERAVEKFKILMNVVIIVSVSIMPLIIFRLLLILLMMCSQSRAIRQRYVTINFRAVKTSVSEQRFVCGN